ncbi:cupin domain-containing protein [Roseibium sp.]|uniref:cupin domain-containing protein n=1 Tax=Roseibium sp. TaxID=1936156 RepID=UPI003A979C86
MSASAETRKLPTYESRTDLMGNGAIEGMFDYALLNLDLMKDAPIRQEWIIEGTPQAKSHNLVSGNRGWSSIDHWSCTKGKFRWYFEWDETVLILDGEVVITDNDGQVYVGRPGTTMHFPAGTSAIWDVPHYVRKIAFSCRVLPPYLHFLGRAVGKLRRMAGLDKAPTGNSLG